MTDDNFNPQVIEMCFSEGVESYLLSKGLCFDTRAAPKVFKGGAGGRGY